MVGDVDGENASTKIGLAVGSTVGSREEADVVIIEGDLMVLLMASNWV